MTIPATVEYYQNNNVTLRIDEWGPNKKYWIQVGIAAIELNRQDIDDLTEMLIELQKDDQDE